MRFTWIAILGISLLVSQVQAQEQPALQTEKDKVSYSIGIDIGNTLKRQAIDVNLDLVTRGLKDAMTGEKFLMTEEQILETVTNFRKEMIAKQQEQAKKLGEKNIKEGEAFLEENKKKEGVQTLPSGLQYKVIKPGTGKKPKPTDNVTTHYRGTLVDGTEFDSSYKRGTPVTFPVNGVIPGWTEALQLMQEGAKWQLFLPPNLAYGERGAGRDVGPNATLIFEVELISVQENK